MLSLNRLCHTLCKTYGVYVYIDLFYVQVVGHIYPHVFTPSKYCVIAELKAIIRK